jgi:hypothetical protein
MFKSGVLFVYSPLAGSPTMTPNGPVVWEVAVCVGVGMCFCKSPDRWTGIFSSRRNCPDGVVPVDGQELSRHDKTVLVAMQKP